MKRLLTIALLLVSSTAMADWTLKGTGTAFIVNKNYALTAAHVLKECDGASIRHQHKEMDAEIVVLDVPNDLGLLLLKEPFEHTAKFRSGKAIRLGDTVVNYGYPLFGQLSDHAKVTTGEINSLAGWNNDSREIQYNAATQPGNSGGPVLDQSGNIVGVVTSGLSGEYAEDTGHIAQNVNFAIKSFVAEAFLSANGVDYETAESVERLETADIAEKAETFTVLVGCWEGSRDSNAESESDKPATAQNKKFGVPISLGTRNDRLAIKDSSTHQYDKQKPQHCKSYEKGEFRSCNYHYHQEVIQSTCSRSPGSPWPKDFVTKIDGKDVSKMSPVAAEKLLNEGPEGSTVILDIWRLGLYGRSTLYDCRFKTKMRRVFLQ